MQIYVNTKYYTASKFAIKGFKEVAKRFISEMCSGLNAKM